MPERLGTNVPAESPSPAGRHALPPAPGSAARGWRRGPRSLRWRLQVWHALILLVVVTGLGGALWWQIRSTRMAEVDEELTSAARGLEGALKAVPVPVLRGFDDVRGEPIWPGGGRRPPPGDRRRGPPRGEGPPRPGGESPFDDHPPPPPPHFPPDHPGPGGPGGPGPPGGRGYPREQLEAALQLPAPLAARYADRQVPPYFAIWRPDGELLRGLGWPPPGHASAARNADPTAPAGGRSARGLREVLLVGPEGTRIVVGRSIEVERRELTQLGWRLALAGATVLAAGLAGGWWLSARVVEPIQAMSRTAGRITAENLHERIDLAGVDLELSELGGLLNDMLARLQRSFAQERQFTADASHELRTPLAVILSHLELALSRPRTGEQYRDTLETCQRAGLRLKSLIDELLLLARADTGHLDLRPRPVDLRELAQEVARQLGPLAVAEQVELLVTGEPLTLEADPERLAQVLTNLTTNAIRYNRPGGRVELQVARHGAEARLRVSDTGIGISPVDLPRIFDRFFRVEAARGRGHGGSGLGLAICRTLVEAHGGTLSATSQPGQGSTFTVALPLLAGDRSSATRTGGDTA